MEGETTEWEMVFEHILIDTGLISRMFIRNETMQ